MKNSKNLSGIWHAGFGKSQLDIPSHEHSLFIIE